MIALAYCVFGTETDCPVPSFSFWSSGTLPAVAGCACACGGGVAMVLGGAVAGVSEVQMLSKMHHEKRLRYIDIPPCFNFSKAEHLFLAYYG